MKTSTASPLKSAAEEIRVLRLLFRATLKAYSAAVEQQIAEFQTALNAETGSKKPAPDRLHDARDIITLIRTLEIDPAKGRRKDLKKIEKTIEDLEKITSGWKP